MIAECGAGLAGSPRSVPATGIGLVRSIRPYPPSTLGEAPCGCHRDSLYETASSTLAGTPTSLPAAANVAIGVPAWRAGTTCAGLSAASAAVLTNVIAPLPAA